MKHLLILSIIILFFQGCSKDKNSDHPPLSGRALKALIIKAIGGDKSINDSLNGFTDLSYPVNLNYTQLKIDSITLDERLYIVLLEYPNPVYNRFAVYNNRLNLYLLDKSLNGFLNSDVIEINNNIFVKVEEAFNTKGSLEVNRLSMYKADSSIELSFRSFTFLKTSRNSYEQKILEVSNERVRTVITTAKSSKLRNKEDIFLYDAVDKKYSSAQNLFDNFILEEIGKYNSPSDQPEIADEKTAFESAGINPGADTISSYGSTVSGHGYNIMLSEEWTEITKSEYSEKLNKKMPAFSYRNKNTGAQFIIIKVPQNDSAEMYVNYKLDRVLAGNYKVRYSNKVNEKNVYLTFFEFSCETYKFLIILAAPVNSYEIFKDEYSNILNTFYMDC